MPTRKPGLRSKGRRLGAALAASLLAAAAPCGTIVIPPGLGVAGPAAVTGLHPLLGAALSNQQIAGVLYRPLLYIDPQHNIDAALSIAERVDVLDHGGAYHVAMKHWVWSDGAPVTADDVLYCLELVRQLGETWSGLGTADMPGIIADLHVDGAYDFTVTLKHPVNPHAFILNGLQLLYALPRHAWGAATTDEMWQRQSDPAFFAVVDGPYRLGRFAMGRFLTLEANPTYSGPPPQIARIVVNFLEGTSELRALQAGEVDAANLKFTVWDAARALPGFRLVTLPPPEAFEYFGLNFRNPATPFFAEMRVRQAMADALDQKLMIALVYHGSADESHGPLPAEPAEALSPAARAGRYPVGYDPDRARSLLDAAGWAPGADGIRTKAGQRLAFSLVLTAGRDETSAVAQIARRELAAVGIEMHISEVSFGQVVAMTNGDPAGWEAYSLGWTQPPYVDGMSLFGTGGVNNYGRYSDPEMDRLATAINTDTGDAASFAFQDYVAEQQPVVFIPSPRYTVMVREGVEGITDFISPLNTWAPEYLRLTGAMACTDAHPRQPS